MTAPKIAVIYYSLYGHIAKLVHAAAEGAKAKGAQVSIYRFPETLSDEVLAKMGAAPKEDHPAISPNDLKDYDGYIFCFPTRYGRAVAQVSAFFDMTGGLWATQALNGKMATIIVSTGTQHGGQETTVLTTIPYLAHHGIIYVPIGYKNSIITDMSEVLAGSPYGAATLAASDGSRQPSEKELALSKWHGEHFTEILTKYVS
ncbi:NAD(P)H:quinone oxidoreductase, type IV [Serendipita vermifera]|nr:NAD(P)H:quinone oxidoreductase, type IV [Serendipita vermifera]